MQPNAFRKLFGTTGFCRIGVTVIASAIAVSSPVWAQDSDGDGIGDTDEGVHNGGVDEVLSNNAGFESPSGLSGSTKGDEDTVPFWDTTASDDQIELWEDNTQGVPAHEGSQFAELNANEPAALFQDVATIPGTSLRWSVAHRGRNGTDTATFSVGVPGDALTLVRTMVSPNTEWSVYTGSLVIPAGQTTTRVQFEAIGSGSSGNFLDAFELTTVSRDNDADFTPDYLDIDSDNDGIPDIAECSVSVSSSGCNDFDNDGLADFRDIDSDDDGIPDNVEIQSTADYVPPSGLYPADFIDTNNDGLDDAYDDTTAAGMASGMAGTGFNYDPVAGSAHLNVDADGDTFLDSAESGIVDQGTGNGDADMDGLQDRYEGADAIDGFVVNGEITDPSTDLTNQLGDATEVGYREAFAAPSVTALTTGDNTPTIVGTHTSAAELTVVVDSVEYTEDSSAILVDNEDNTWTLSIGTELSDDTYDVAVSSSSLTGDLSDNTVDELVINTTAPQPNLLIDDITADNILNVEEANNASFSVTGTVTGDFLENDTVTLTIDGTEFTGSVDASGNYSIEVPSSELSANTLITGSVETVGPLGVTGSGTATHAYLVDLVPPQVSGTVSGDAEDIDITGSSDEPEGSTVTVSNADGDEICSTVLDAGGNWACSATNLDNFAEQVLTATVIDPAGNSTSNVLDAPDSDNDGIPDSVEGTVDSDGDLIPDYLDLDSDNDSLLDETESLSGADIDSDGDGIVDRLDLDSDNDGLFDAIENGVHGALDSDGNGRLDGDVGDNGIVDALETTPDSDAIDLNNDGIPDAPVDTDSDNISDALDIDSDGDGITDAFEASGSDVDGDGRIDGFADNNDDGMDDASALAPLVDPDTDGDGSVDRLDTDADNDGIDDAIEADASSLLPRDTDADGIPDFRDEDTDDDGVNDSVERGEGSGPAIDADGDGIPDYRDIDSDNDGIEDGDEPINVDADSNGIPDRVDQDDDGDGIPDSVEGLRDSDGDGVVDSLDLDSDNDGLPDSLEAGTLTDDGIPVDTDGDGIPDYRDRDSDNDGLSDTLESQGLEADADRNGVLDGFTDSDGDGQDDGNAAFPITPDDIDTDEIPDHLDVDTDGDGSFDIVEGGVTGVGDVDSDSDGALDSMTDSDGDLIPDLVDVDSVGGPDTDGDGIVDTADVDFTGGVDTDGDGIDDESDPDANGDGLADLFADASQTPPLPDVNGDNIPDVDQVLDLPLPETEGVFRTGLQGGGCSVAYGAGTSDLMLPILGLFALAGVFIRRRKVIPCAAKHSRTSAIALLTAGCCTLVFAPIDVLHAADGDTVQSKAEEATLTTEPVLNDEAFQRRFYLGIGLGRSWLEPDTSEVEGVDPNDRVNLGGQITLGTDLKNWLSMELHAATLGDAGLSNGDSIGYDQVGISALFYAGGARNRFNRRGFTGFGRVGLGGLINDTDINSGVSLVQDNSAHVSLGLGAEFATRMGLALRAEGIVFDQDVNYLQLGLLYRFGRRQERVGEEIVVDDPTIIPPQSTKTIPAPETEALVIIDAVDNDSDGVDDSSDQCLDTTEGIAVDETGCDIFNGVIEGLTFLSGSAELTSESREILDEVANTLNRLPDMMFELTAHTDNVGDADMNMELSIQRARSVAAYLVRTGIPVSRFTAKAFGESRPVESNETAEGRRTNRRVELVVKR